MRSKLLGSFLYVFVFWWLAFTVYWSVSDPKSNAATLSNLKHFLHDTPVISLIGQYIAIDIPAAPDITNSLFIQAKVFVYWTFPVITLAALSAILGAVLVWTLALRKSSARVVREKGTGGGFRGTSITLGDLPRPLAPGMDSLELDSSSETALQKLSDKELALLGDILGILSKNEESATVPEKNLLSTALEDTEKGLGSPFKPGLCAIAAAGRHLGKITSYKKVGEALEQARNVERESARIISGLPSWWNLPEDDRIGVLLAVKYSNTADEIPIMGLGGELTKLGHTIIQSLLSASLAPTPDPQSVPGSAEPVRSPASDRANYPAAPVAPAPEPERRLPATPGAVSEITPTPVTVPDINLTDVALKSFLKALPTLPFQNGLPKGVPAVGWKKGRRLYLIEIKLRETLLRSLTGNAQLAFSKELKEGKQSKIYAFTQELLKAFDEKGWLVKSVDSASVPTKEALWVITAGTKEFKGVIILDIDKDYLDQLPEDSFYEIKIVRPLFQQVGSFAASRGDMDGLLKPKAVPSQV